jgi:hypothetical protein
VIEQHETGKPIDGQERHDSPYAMVFHDLPLRGGKERLDPSRRRQQQDIFVDLQPRHQRTVEIDGHVPQIANVTAHGAGDHKSRADPVVLAEERGFTPGHLVEPAADQQTKGAEVGDQRDRSGQLLENPVAKAR